MTPDEFIGDKVTYDRSGQMIFGHKRDGLQLLLDVRGWGAIQHLFKTEKEAADFQDEFGEWIATAINEKLHAAHQKSEIKMPSEAEMKKRQKDKAEYLRELGYPPRVIVKYQDAIKETWEWIHGQIT